MMLKNVVPVVFGVLAGILLCLLFRGTPEQWVPVLEDTHFTYLGDEVDKALASLSAARVSAGKDGDEPVLASLHEADKTLRRIKSYFLPMTDVRQLIYDADRLFFMKRRDEAARKLEASKKLLLAVDSAGDGRLREVINDLITMIDRLVLNIEVAPEDVPGDFQKVGQKVNMMLIRGELVLGDREVR